MTEALKSCPFCGAPGGVFGSGVRGVYIACEGSDCAVDPATKYFNTLDEAIAAWNRRTNGLDEAALDIIKRKIWGV